MGLSDMKLKSLRFMVKGKGMMRETKTAISKTRRAKTCNDTMLACRYPFAFCSHCRTGAYIKLGIFADCCC